MKILPALKFQQMTRATFLLLALLSGPQSLLRAQNSALRVRPNSVRFAAIGDMGTGEPPQYEVAQRMFQSRQTFPFNFVIMLGDNIYGGKSPAELQKKFDIPYKPLLDV